MNCLSFTLKHLLKKERIDLFKNLLNNEMINKQSLKTNDEIVFAEKTHIGLAKLISPFEIETMEFSDGKQFSRLLNLYDDTLVIRLRREKKQMSKYTVNYERMNLKRIPFTIQKYEYEYLKLLIGEKPMNTIIKEALNEYLREKIFNV